MKPWLTYSLWTIVILILTQILLYFYIDWQGIALIMGFVIAAVVAVIFIPIDYYILAKKIPQKGNLLWVRMISIAILIQLVYFVAEKIK